MAVTRTFGSLDPGDLFVATNDIHTDLVPMLKSEDGKSASAYGRGGEIHHGAVHLWPQPEGAIEFGVRNLKLENSEKNLPRLNS